MIHAYPAPISEIPVTHTAIVRSSRMATRFGMARATLVYVRDLIVIHPDNRLPRI